MPYPVHRLLAASLAISMASMDVSAAASIALPDLGDPSAAVMSPAEECKIGEEFMRRARRSLAFVDDPEVGGYIQALGQRLSTHSDSEYEFRFFAVADSTINAFAVPGGFVGVHTGLILAAQDEGELASVLAHESAHVAQRHIPRMIAESQRASIPAMAAILASILLASSGHQGAEAGIALSTATVVQKELNFSRALEEEADRIGMGILDRAGFDPRAMPAFFERMQALNRVNDTNLPEFLRTHPVTTNRIADARNRAERFAPKPVPDSSEFRHVRAKLRAQAPGDSADIVRSFRTNLDQSLYRDADAERYGYALALLRAKELAPARLEARKLVERRPNQVFYRILQAEIEMTDGKYDEALAILAQAHKRSPAHPALLRHYGEALLRVDRPAAAQNILREATRRQPDDPALFKLLATAAGRAGTKTEAHRALAEHYYLMGDLNAAVDQLRIASRFAGDNFYLQSSLEARMNAIKEEIALFHAK